MNDAVLKADQLTKTYTDGGLHVDVLTACNLNVTKGEMVAIVGVSGSGKSTLLQLLGGLDKPTSGHVYITGKEISRLRQTERGRLRNRYLGFVFQFHHLLPEFNALENVCIPLLIRGVHPKMVEAQAMDFITRVGLKDRYKHRIGELSGGERQRIAIARALVTKPHCVLADEPTGNLDERTAEQIAELILEMNAAIGTSFIVVTHNRPLAKRMQRILVLEDGQLHPE